MSKADLLEILEEVVDHMVKEGCINTTQGKWRFDFTELSAHLPAADIDRYQQAICDVLAGREEVAAVETVDGYFDITYYADFCPGWDIEQYKTAPNVAEKAEKPSIIAQLEAHRQAALKGPNPLENTPNHNMERELS